MLTAEELRKKRLEKLLRRRSILAMRLKMFGEKSKPRSYIAMGSKEIKKGWWQIIKKFLLNIINLKKYVRC